jgi:ferrous iron transport protein A
VKNTNRSVADLKIGERGIIKGFSDSLISLKLMEMGCLPGTEVKLRYIAPLGDPICISVSGYNLSLRMDEASIISLEK